MQHLLPLLALSSPSACLSVGFEARFSRCSISARPFLPDPMLSLFLFPLDYRSSLTQSQRPSFRRFLLRLVFRLGFPSIVATGSVALLLIPYSPARRGTSFPPIPPCRWTRAEHVPHSELASPFPQVVVRYSKSSRNCFGPLS